MPVLIFLLSIGCARNKEPYTPILKGPTLVGVNADAQFKAYTTDPNKDEIRYIFDWEDKTETTKTYFPSGETITVSHRWSTVKIYNCRVRAQDKKGKISDWSEVLKVNVVTNTKPNTPTVIIGPNSGLVDSSYTFTTSATDPDGDSILIFFIWDDGKIDTTPFKASGENFSASHKYSAPGTYNIRAVAQDKKFALSDTSPAKTFTVRTQFYPGDIIWKVLVDDDVISSPALVMENNVPMVYIGAQDGKVYKFNGKTGAKIAEYSSPIIGDEFNSSPAIGTNGTVYIGSNEGYLFALNPDLSFKWKWPNSPLNASFNSSPALTADGKIIIGNENGNIYCLRDAGSFAESLWSYQVPSGEVFSSPAIDGGGYIYFADQSDSGFVYKLDPNGSRQWSVATGAEVYSSPALDDQGNIFIASTSGKVFAFMPDGTPLTGWPVILPETLEVSSSPVFDSSGLLFLGLGEARGIIIIRPNGTILLHRPTPPDEVNSTPAVARGGVVYYLTNEGTFIGYDYLTNSELFSINLSEKSPGKKQDEIFPSPTIAPDGTIYIAYDQYIYGIYGNRPLANSPWPKFRQGLKNTGRTNGGKI